MIALIGMRSAIRENSRPSRSQILHRSGQYPESLSFHRSPVLGGYCEIAFDGGRPNARRRQAFTEARKRRPRKTGRKAVGQYEKAREEARQRYESNKATFLSEQERSNKALTDFRRAFEAGEASAIIEYCSRILERSQYPDWVVMSNKTEFDEDSGFVVVDLELPTVETTPTAAGYKFVSRDNSVEPIPLKTKEADTLYESVLDQLVLRTIHEIIEACHIDTVKGVLLNGWMTSIDRATGNDSRQRLRSVAANRVTF